MLEYLHVKNLALIKECEILFGEGLNILTGETGAGKSVLLGSINMCLGAKAEKDIIRAGESEAFVELMFTSNKEAEALLNEMEISSSDESVSISRKITQAKNIFKINGEVATAKQVKELAGTLLDIHGQSEHQSLLSNIKQRDMLDLFGGAPIKEAKEQVLKAYSDYTHLAKELSEVSGLSEGRERELSLLRYETKEIEDANLFEGEDVSLEEEYKRMQSSEKLLEYVSGAEALVSSGRDGDIGSLLSKAISDMRRAGALDSSASDMEDLLLQAESLLGDFSLLASKYCDNLEFSPERFNEVEERLNVINSLKLKFGNSINDILKYYDEKISELEKLENLDEYLEKLKSDTEKALNDYKSKAGALSELRKKASYDFSDLLMNELLVLNFNQAKFTVEFDTNEELVSSSGFDKIEFMISTNPGNPVKPMKNVASGGELSRIMLAIKTILAKKDAVDALIFDEIDAGISGKTAWEVAGRLSKLSKEHQVIAITHLAQIAAAADSHFEIEKSATGNSTETKIIKLDKDGEIKELARLLGSDELNEATILNAKELKEKATERKNSYEKA